MASALQPAFDWREFGLDIGKLRRREGLTQAQLGERVGCGWLTIHNIEAGHPGCAVDTVARVAREVGHPLADCLPQVTRDEAAA